MGASHTARCLLFPFVSRPVTTIYKYRVKLSPDDVGAAQPPRKADDVFMPRCSSYDSNLSLLTPNTRRRRKREKEKEKEDGHYVEWKTDFEVCRTPTSGHRRLNMTEAVAGQMTPKGFPAFTDAVKARELCTPIKGRLLENEQSHQGRQHNHQHLHHHHHNHHQVEAEKRPVDQAQQTAKPNIPDPSADKKVKRRLSWRLPVIFNSPTPAHVVTSKKTKSKTSKDKLLIQNSKPKLQPPQHQQQQEQQQLRQYQQQPKEKRDCCKCKQQSVRKVRKLNKATQTVDLGFAPMPVYGYLPFPPCYVYETPQDILPYAANNNNAALQQNHIKDLEAYCGMRLQYYYL